MDSESIKLVIKQLKFRFRPAKFPYKPFNHKHKTIFIHIPKVAGTSILDLLVGSHINRDHLTYKTYEQANGSLFRRYFKFSLVRNPYDRAVSLYEYLKNGGNGKSDLYFKDIIHEKYNNFDLFVMDFMNKDIIHSHVLFKPQYLYIYNEKGECMVDFCGRFENINNDFNYIMKKLRIKGELKNLNQSKKKSNYREYYTNPSVRKKIEYLYSKDFEVFNYEYM